MMPPGPQASPAHTHCSGQDSPSRPKGNPRRDGVGKDSLETGTVQHKELVFEEVVELVQVPLRLHRLLTHSRRGHMHPVAHVLRRVYKLVGHALHTPSSTCVLQDRIYSRTLDRTFDRTSVRLLFLHLGRRGEDILE